MVDLDAIKASGQNSDDVSQRMLDSHRRLDPMIVAEPLTPVTNWTAKELDRLDKRVTMFRRRGMPVAQVVHFAERLAARDRDLDDRRACIECAHLQRGGGCFAAQQGWLQGVSPKLTPVTDILKRCERFQWQTT